MKLPRFSLRQLLVSMTLIAIGIAISASVYRFITKPLRMSFVKVGMSIAEIENALGEPLFVRAIGKSKPPFAQFRHYQGDWDGKIVITFRGEQVVGFYETKHHYDPYGIHEFG